MEIIGVCGDDCAHCPRYIATQEGNPAKLEQVRELWVRLGLREPSFPAEEFACYGCASEAKCAYPELRQCAVTKHIANCGLCEDYPCELIEAAFGKTRTLESKIAGLCSPNELETLKQAFFYKKRTLDRIHGQLKKGHGK